MTLDEVVKVALIGTGRSGATDPPPAGALGEAMTAIKPDGGAEATLLARAALLSAYEACGRMPTAAPELPSSAPADAMPACSPRSADVLGQLLAMTNTPAKQRLLGEWLDHANRAHRRVPHALLPALLEYGASYRALRSFISEAADARGRWLMELNPRWRFGVAEADDPQQVWSTGTAAQRGAAIRLLRASDPKRARELIAST